jgi:hypothetical protein
MFKGRAGTEAVVVLGLALLFMGGCDAQNSSPGGLQGVPAVCAETRDILVTRGPIILRSPGVPAVVVVTPEDGPAELPAEIGADPDLTTITVPTGTVVTQNAGGNPKSLTLLVEEAHSGDGIGIGSARNMIFNITQKVRRGPAASRP